VNKRSECELKRIVEAAVAKICHLPRPGLWFCVDKVELSGHPPSHLKVWATLHFLPAGSPFCCGEPGCHLGLFGDRLAEVEDHVRREFGLQHSVEVDFGDRIAAQYHSGIRFKSVTSL
jgi:hypothetical protein